MPVCWQRLRGPGTLRPLISIPRSSKRRDHALSTSVKWKLMVEVADGIQGYVSRAPMTGLLPPPAGTAYPTSWGAQLRPNGKLEMNYTAGPWKVSEPTSILAMGAGTASATQLYDFPPSRRRGFLFCVHSKQTEKETTEQEEPSRDAWKAEASKKAVSIKQEGVSARMRPQHCPADAVDEALAARCWSWRRRSWERASSRMCAMNCASGMDAPISPLIGTRPSSMLPCRIANYRV